MKPTQNTILLTGGSTGIGFTMAKYLLEKGNTVVICGRREDRLKQAKEALPCVHIFTCDVANHADREALFKHMKTNFPSMNVLINNAGVQRDIDLTQGMRDLSGNECEIKINFEAPIYLSALFTPLIAKNDQPAIINVSSGLAFMAERAIGMPVYCATKAALHAFSLAQRKQLAPMGIKVIEIIPPMVESELNIEGRRKRNMQNSPHMMSSEDFVNVAMSRLEAGEEEIRIVKQTV